MGDGARRGLPARAALALVCAAAACSREDPMPASGTPPGALAPPAAATTTAVAELPGNVTPLARMSTDLGRMPGDTVLEGISLLFRPAPDQRAREKATLSALSNPLSPRYRKWLTPAEVAAVVGASSADVGRASAWLAGQGFTVHGVSPTGARLLFSGTVEEVERAFATEVHRLAFRGAEHFAMTAAPRVPDDMARFVLGLRGVHDFQLEPLLPKPRTPPSPAYLFDGGAPDAGAGGGLLTLAPADFATIYDIAPLTAAGITGKGQTLAVVGASDFNDADITAFRSTFGLDTSLTPVRDLVPHSGKSVVRDPNFFGETELDLEWSGAVASEATIAYVYTGANRAYGAFDAIAWAVEEGKYPVVSASYTACEGYFTPVEDIFLESMGDAAAMEGVTVLVASGDWGAATCEYPYDNVETAAAHGLSVGWPASVPSFVAVGGTMLDWGDPIPEAPITPAVASASPFSTYWTCSFGAPSACSPNGYVPETGWNEIAHDILAFNYFWGASGGGTSVLFSKPYWQVGVTPSGTARLVPDVSVSAAWQQVGYVVSQSWTAADGMEQPPQPEALQVSGGTSAATPSFAGVLALVNQALAEKNPGDPVGLGNANPVLYALASSTGGTATPAFHDVTTGDNVVPCAPGTPDCPSSPPYQFGYSAAAGYDMVTGLGSVDVNNLVSAWTSLVPTVTAVSVSSSGTTEGSMVTMTATVSSLATSTSMTGSVVFYVDTTDEGGLADLSLASSSPVTATLTAGLEGATASATVVQPPGVLGTANVVAFYGGDAHYLASWSSASSVATTSTLAVTPGAATVHPNAMQTFKATGGVPPVQWNIVNDTTCDKSFTCAAAESISATEGVYQAGPADGKTILAAIDHDGAEVRVVVTVTGAPVDGGTLPPPWDGGEAGADAEAGTMDGAPDAPSDAPSDATGATDATRGDAARDASSDREERADARPHEDAGRGGGRDAGAADAADGGVAPPPQGGCSCRAPGRAPGSGGFGFVHLALAALLLARRRNARRTADGRGGGAGGGAAERDPAARESSS